MHGIDERMVTEHQRRPPRSGRTSECTAPAGGEAERWTREEATPSAPPPPRAPSLQLREVLQLMDHQVEVWLVQLQIAQGAQGGVV